MKQITLKTNDDKWISLDNAMISSLLRQRDKEFANMFLNEVVIPGGTIFIDDTLYEDLRDWFSGRIYRKCFSPGQCKRYEWNNES